MVDGFSVVFEQLGLHGSQRELVEQHDFDEAQANFLAHPLSLLGRGPVHLCHLLPPPLLGFVAGAPLLWSLRSY